MSTHQLNLMSNIGQLWLIDLDGTVVTHNAYLNTGDELLPGVTEFFSDIPENHVIIILTARKEKYHQSTINFLNQKKLRFNYLLMNMPTGERILINDKKPDGTKTAYAFNLIRNSGLGSLKIKYNK